jgi:outer membrane protein TolC
MSEWRLESAEQDAVSQVVQAFYGVLLAELMLEVSEEALQIAGEGYEIAMLKYDAGTISRFELLQSRVAFENRKPEAIAAESALENAIVGFSVALGLDCGDMNVIEGDLFDPLPVFIPGTLDEAMEIMRAESPDLRVAESIEDLGDAGVCMARASFMPRLVARSDYSFVAAVEALGNLDPGDYHRSWSTSVSLEVPIFNGINDIASYNSARYERLAARAEARSLVQMTELSLVQAWNSSEQAFEQLLATEATLAQAEEAAGIAAVSYEAGMITRLEMDQAFLALTQARSNHALALYSLRTAEARLTRAMGNLRIGE